MRSPKVYSVLLVTVMMSVMSISAYAAVGTNCYSVPDGGSEYNFDVPNIPADFFSPGSDPFGGTVCLVGNDQNSNDVVVDRLDPLLFPTCSSTSPTIAIEIVQLDLVSCQPITVTYNGGQDPEEWDVTVDLSVIPPPPFPPSLLTAAKEHCNGGVFSSILYVQPRFTFTMVSNPLDVRVLDTGLEGTPPEELNNIATYSWQDTPPAEPSLCDGNGFYPVGTEPYVMQSASLFLELLPQQAEGCTAADNSIGTADLPVSCDYAATLGPMLAAIDGSPDVIRMHPTLKNHMNVVRVGASKLGGEVDYFESTLELQMDATGSLENFNRNIFIPVNCEVHTGPRKPGDPVQTFPNEMFKFEGQISGDPDFDLLKITGGTNFGLPSPGHTTLTQLPAGDFAVDSFFDITYQIEFVGAPGSILEGMSGTTTGTVTIQQGDAQRQYYSGLPHRAMGLCDMVSDGGGWEVFLSNIGSSGEDGVDIDVGGADGFSFEADFGQAGALPPGSDFSVRMYSGSVLRDVDYWEISVKETNGGQAALSIGMDSDSILVGYRISTEILLDDLIADDGDTRVLLLGNPLVVGDIGSSGEDGVRFCSRTWTPGCSDNLPACVLDSDYPANMPIKLTSITLPAPTTLTLDGSVPVVGDQIRFSLDYDYGQPWDAVPCIPFVEAWDQVPAIPFSNGSQVELRAANTGDIRIRDEKVVKFGTNHIALGQAKMYGNTVPYGADIWYGCGSGLTVYNIGSSGEDGVSIELSGGSNIRGIPDECFPAVKTIYIGDLGDADSTKDGAYIEAKGKGTVETMPYQTVSRIRHEDIGSQVRTSIESLIPIVPGSLTAEYFLNGQVVLVQPNIQLSDVWLGIRIPIDYKFSWDRRTWEIDFGWSYFKKKEQDNRLILPGGADIIVDEVVITGTTTAAFEGYSSVELTAADIGAFTITCEKTVCEATCGDADHPYPKGDVNHDCHTNLLDLSEVGMGWLACSHPDGCL